MLSRPTGGPAGLAASGADGYLSLFNLSSAAIGPASLTVPQRGEILLYQGMQTTVSGGTAYQVSLPAATAAMEPPRFALASRPALPTGLQVTVADSLHVSITAPAGSATVHGTLTSKASGEQQSVTVKSGQTVQVVFRQERLTPSANLALGRTTFPTSPLPAAISDPASTVDGNPATTWRPGPGGRMVIDLGPRLSLGTLELMWADGRAPAATISVSDDGLSYTAAGSTSAGLARRRPSSVPQRATWPSRCSAGPPMTPTSPRSPWSRPDKHMPEVFFQPAGDHLGAASRIPGR